MTWNERVAALSDLGLTERQAEFLTTVMLHSGVCMGRQYCAYAGITYGRKMVDFFRLLLVRGYAIARGCGYQNARLYHVHHRPLYRAIGRAGLAQRYMRRGWQHRSFAEPPLVL